MGKIELRKWTFHDKENLMAICNAVNRGYLSNRLPFPYTESDAKWWLDMVEEHDGKDGIFRAVLVDGTIVGNISVEQKSDVYGKDAEIGYLLITEKWSQGIMTEAVGQICNLAFSSLDIIRITGLVYEPNSGSRRVLEKNGFILEGIQMCIRDRDMVASDSQWEQLFEEASSRVKQYADYKGRLDESADTLYACLKFDDEISRETELLYVYSRMRSDQDTADQKYQDMLSLIHI